MVAPSAISRVAVRVPTTAGIPYSRATTAVCESAPPGIRHDGAGEGEVRRPRWGSHAADEDIAVAEAVGLGEGADDPRPAAVDTRRSARSSQGPRDALFGRQGLAEHRRRGRSAIGGLLAPAFLEDRARGAGPRLQRFDQLVEREVEDIAGIVQEPPRREQPPDVQPAVAGGGGQPLVADGVVVFAHGQQLLRCREGLKQGPDTLVILGACPQLRLQLLAPRDLLGDGPGGGRLLGLLGVAQDEAEGGAGVFEPGRGVRDLPVDGVPELFKELSEPSFEAGIADGGRSGAGSISHGCEQRGVGVEFAAELPERDGSVERAVGEALQERVGVRAPVLAEDLAVRTDELLGELSRGEHALPVDTREDAPELGGLAVEHLAPLARRDVTRLESAELVEERVHREEPLRAPGFERGQSTEVG